MTNGFDPLEWPTGITQENNPCNLAHSVGQILNKNHSSSSSFIRSLVHKLRFFQSSRADADMFSFF